MRARATATVLAAVLVGYLALVGWRGVLLIRDGSAAGVALGLAVLVLPVLAAWLLWRELHFGADTQRLGRQLADEGGLPSDDLPRRPSGRAERGAAHAAFAVRQAEMEAAPEDWRAWFRLAIAYDDAGDRSRARDAMRRAIALHGRGGGGPQPR